MNRFLVRTEQTEGKKKNTSGSFWEHTAGDGQDDPEDILLCLLTDREDEYIRWSAYLICEHLTNADSIYMGVRERNR